MDQPLEQESDHGHQNQAYGSIDNISNGSPSPTITTENFLDEHIKYLKDPSGYQVYGRRWFILIVICIINFTNAMVCAKIIFCLFYHEFLLYFYAVSLLSLVFLIYLAGFCILISNNYIEVDAYYFSNIQVI